MTYGGDKRPTDAAYKAAQRLRRAMSLPEVLLWRHLRRSPQGLRVRRQHPFGPYVLDFYSAATLLCIEVDGAAHRAGGQGERDERRDRWLAAQGVETLRITAAEVLADPQAVAEGILAYALAKKARMER